MQIRDILDAKASQAVASITPEETVKDAIDQLCERNIGALLVVDKGGQPVGIITERDILAQACKDAQGFSQRPVADVMTRDLICGLPADNADYVMQIMTQNKVRHLPIIKDHKVIGLISIGDVIKSQLEITQVENHMLKDYLHLRGEL